MSKANQKARGIRIEMRPSTTLKEVSEGVTREQKETEDIETPNDEVRSTLSNASLVSLYGSKVPIKDEVI